MNIPNSSDGDFPLVSFSSDSYFIEDKYCFWKLYVSWIYDTDGKKIAAPRPT
jgi:hypothetical protein